jgi:BirA family biotin operon repressor/biotin-[acetyl-CoA-carboxylase] ligase
LNIIVSETQYIGKNLIFFKSIPSTNDYAKELLAKSEPKNGSVILAEEQSAGRGQGGNIWQTDAGKNITCSIILDTQLLEIRQQFLLNMAIAVAVHKTVGYFLENNDIKIKWPNDILVENKKIAGILIENTIQGTNMQKSIIGVGLNINQNNFDENLQATSLSIEKNNTEIDIILVLKKLLLSIEEMYAQIQQERYIKEIYMHHLFWLNEWHDFEYNGNKIIGKIIDINNFGQLILESDNKHLIINQKEIRHLI